MQADRVLWWRSAGAHAPCIPLGALLAQRIAQRSRVPACLQRSQLGQWNPIPPEQCGQFSCKPLERSASNNIDETFSKVSKFIFILDAEFEFLKARLALRRRLRLPAHSGHLRPQQWRSYGEYLKITICIFPAPCRELPRLPVRLRAFVSIQHIQADPQFSLHRSRAHPSYLLRPNRALRNHQRSYQCAPHEPSRYWRLDRLHPRTSHRNTHYSVPRRWVSAAAPLSGHSRMRSGRAHRRTRQTKRAGRSLWHRENS